MKPLLGIIIYLQDGGKKYILTYLAATDDENQKFLLTKNNFFDKLIKN